MTAPVWNRGSQWHRWDPHLHAPGTHLNDGFLNDWIGYESRVAGASPQPMALGITDYFSTRAYRAVLDRKRKGSFPSIPLIFPNIELRLTIQTRDKGGVNIHLLVCPNDIDHVERIDEALGRLSWSHGGIPYPCTDDGLCRLGRVMQNDPNYPEIAAITRGVNQFKIDLEALRGLFDNDKWVKENVLVALAAGDDGLSGLSKDASFASLRQELSRFSDIIFSGQPTDRSFWLGGRQDFQQYNLQPRPCLHGSDAHELARVLSPDKERYCWIRGDDSFDSLRQALSEPERRVWIGPCPPPGPSPSHLIQKVTFIGAPWIANGSVELNDGLISIIGSKGSGKTALADLIAFGAGAQERDPSPASFFRKAQPLLGSLEVQLDWGDGTSTSAKIADFWQGDVQRAKYLSQQFVETLCGTSDLTDSLVSEIQRVVFNAIPTEDRFECSGFDDLADIKLQGPASNREAQRRAVLAANRAVADEDKLIASKDALARKLADAKRQREGLEAEIKAMPVTGKDEHVAALRSVQDKLLTLRPAIAYWDKCVQQLKDLRADIERIIEGNKTQISEIKKRNVGLIADELWTVLTPTIDAGSLAQLTQLDSAARTTAAQMREFGVMIPDPKSPEGEKVPTGGLAVLISEETRLTKTLGLDQANATKRGDLEKRLNEARISEGKAVVDVTQAGGAPDRRKHAFALRAEKYQAVFRALLEEESTLRSLYAPLMSRCATDAKLARLTVTVHRMVDYSSWAERGEQLFDLRKTPFKRGEIALLAQQHLLQSWRTGTPELVMEPLRQFMDQHGPGMLGSLMPGKTRADLGDWFFDTTHIRVAYGIQYDGVDLERLSPGTRGVVLLTLYLALDDSDQRPLIIDQPEENLDPRSVYQDLMPFFRDAAKRRQIIMVTHNANLVVNSDSDQVIVATASRKSPNALPTIEYRSGGLEKPWIRAEVCDVLEGGDDAFRMRGQRYGV